MVLKFSVVLRNTLETIAYIQPASYGKIRQYELCRLTSPEERQIKLLKWLCPVPLVNECTRRIHCTEGTGQWIFRMELYQKWECTPTSFLLVQGKGTTLFTLC